MDKDKVTTSDPLRDPTHCEAARHPGDSEALRAPGVVAFADDTLDGEPSEPGVTTPGVPYTSTLPWAELPAVPSSGVTTPDSAARYEAVHVAAQAKRAAEAKFALSPGQARFAAQEAGCEAVRRAVVLPVMPDAWRATREVHRALRAAQDLVHVWGDVGDELLGELTHAQAGLHASVMNVSGFAATAAELIDRHVSLPSQWTATFEAILAEASRHGAYRLMALASAALLVGPFTVTWDNAVDWCLAYWAYGAGA